MIAAFAIAVLLAFAAGWAVCNDLKDRRAEREAAKARDAEAREKAAEERSRDLYQRAGYMEAQAHRLAKALAEVGEQRQRAEAACEELRKQVMRGAEVARWTWPEGKRPTNADASYPIFLTTLGPCAPTDEALGVMLERGRKLLLSDDGST